jgi:hypothetical protein
MQQEKDLSLIIGLGVSPSQMIEFCCQTVSHFFLAMDSRSNGWRVREAILLIYSKMVEISFRLIHFFKIGQLIYPAELI